MVKHTQIIRWQFAHNCLSVFDHFVLLALKGLSTQSSIIKTHLLFRILIAHVVLGYINDLRTKAIFIKYCIKYARISVVADQYSVDSVLMRENTSQ